MYWYRSSPFWLCLRYHISAASIFFLLHNHHFPWHPHHINNVSCLWADWNQDWHFSAEITWTFTSWYCHRWSWSHDGYEGKRQRLSIWRLMVGIWWILDYLKQNSGFKIFQGQATLTYDNLTWSNEGVAATPCWVLPHPTTYAYCPTKCCLRIKIQPLPFWWNPWSHEMLLGSKQSLVNARRWGFT